MKMIGMGGFRKTAGNMRGALGRRMEEFRSHFLGKKEGGEGHQPPVKGGGKGWMGMVRKMRQPKAEPAPTKNLENPQEPMKE